MRLFVFYTIILLISGCASGQLDLYNVKCEKVGECSAGYNWHPIGVRASVDWLLNHCVESAKNDGMVIHKVSDNSILTKDYSYPSHPSGKKWDRKLAWDAFWSNIISSVEYGYIVADLENAYYLKTKQARDKYNTGAITKKEYDECITKAENAFHGK